jgi:hypothetical protein
LWGNVGAQAAGYNCYAHRIEEDSSEGGNCPLSTREVQIEGFHGAA